MTIIKIISGGQTGADQAALDIAIKMEIPHFGWVPKGRWAEDGRISDKYNLREMPTDIYADRTQQNVLDSDGTVILSHGELTGGSKLTQDLAKEYDRPCLHIDLNITPQFFAATRIYNWIMENNIEVLNVAGPRASNDPEIYKATLHILESALLLGMAGAGPKERSLNSAKGEFLNELPIPPKTVDEAIEKLISEMSLKDKVTLANMSPEELGNLQKSLGKYIRDKFRLSKNDQLIASCRSISDTAIKNSDDASAAIINALYRKLNETHKLKIVR